MVEFSDGQNRVFTGSLYKSGRSVRKTCVKPAQLVLLPGCVSVEFVSALLLASKSDVPCVCVCLWIIYVCKRERETSWNYLYSGSESSSDAELPPLCAARILQILQFSQSPPTELNCPAAPSRAVTHTHARTHHGAQPPNQRWADRPQYRKYYFG